MAVEITLIKINDISWGLILHRITKSGRNLQF